MPSMSSINVPQLYPNNALLADHHFFEFSNPTMAAAGAGAGAGAGGGSLIEGSILWDGDNKQVVPLFDQNGAFDYVVSPDSNRDMISSGSTMSSLSEQLGSASDLDMLAFSDYSTDLHHGISCDQNFGGGYQPAASQLRVNCCNLVEDFDRLAYPIAAPETWGIQCNHEMMKTVEEPQVKVGRYSEEERRERIHRYLKKRTQRNFNKTIKYACRKTLADRRVRVRGRFAKNSDSCDQEEFSMKKDGINPHQQDFYVADAKLQNDDEDEWLQATMANLVHLFHSFPDGTFI